MFTQRGKKFIDYEVQGALIVRAALYGIAFVVWVAAIDVGYQYYWDRDASIVGLLNAHWDTHGRLYGFGLLLLPIIIMDITRLSNRFVGPVYRLRVALKEIKSGQLLKRIKLRNRDYWQDVAEDFNAIATKITSNNNHIDHEETQVLDYIDSMMGTSHAAKSTTSSASPKPADSSTFYKGKRRHIATSLKSKDGATNTVRAVDIMTSNPKCVRADLPTLTLMDIFRKNPGQDICVVNPNGGVIGMVNEREFFHHIAVNRQDPQLQHSQVQQIMNRKIATMPSSSTAAEIAELMLEFQIETVPIVDRNRLVGIVATGDVICLTEALGKHEQLATTS